MAELPAGWGLKTRQREDGKLDVIGNADNGEEYKVKTCASGAVTDQDVEDIRAADRESYASREEGCRIFVNSITRQQVERKEQQEAELESDLVAAAEEVIGQSTTGGRATGPLAVDLPLQCGMSKAYATGKRYWQRQLDGCTDPERRKEIEAALRQMEN